MKRIAFTTLGCKANFADTEEMIAVCRRAGLAIVAFDEEADAYVVNSCTVTAVADQQSRQLLRRPKRKHPGALVIATGCVGAVDPEALAAVWGVDAVFGTKDRHAALAFLFERLGTRDEGRETRDEGRQSRARAFLKIQEGCDRSCAYCIVPQARGRGKSVPAAEIERACRRLARYHREIVLTGIDIGQYRDQESGNEKSCGLLGLLERLVRTSGMPRLRLSSIDPTMVDADLAGLIASSGKICRHIHLSIQSGSDVVLAAMGRDYGATEVERAVRCLVETVPGIAVTGDLIAGFPGEDEAEHRATAELLAGLPLAGLHVFPYSLRAGTRAASMGAQVPQAMRRVRAEELRGIARKARVAFLQSQLGKALAAIVTSRRPNGEGRVSAFSDNAVAIALPAGVVSYGEMGCAVITGISDLEVTGIWDSLPTTRISSGVSKSGWATNSSAAST